MRGGDRAQGFHQGFLEDVSPGPVMLLGNPASSLLRPEGDKAQPGRAGSWPCSEGDLDRGFLSRFLHTSRATTIVLGQ